MNCDEKQKETAAHALGALEPAAASAIDAQAASDPALQSELTRFRDVTAAIAANCVPPKPPSPTLRGRVLDRIRNTPQLQPGAATALPKPPAAPPAGFSFLHANEPWQPTAIPGFEFRVLSVNPKEGYRVILGKLQPGARFPHHIHKTGAEELFVVSGDLVSMGHTMNAGDFMHAESGTDHVDLYSPNGCIALLVEPIEGPEVLA